MYAHCNLNIWGICYEQRAVRHKRPYATNTRHEQREEGRKGGGVGREEQRANNGLPPLAVSLLVLLALGLLLSAVARSRRCRCRVVRPVGSVVPCNDAGYHETQNDDDEVLKKQMITQS